MQVSWSFLDQRETLIHCFESWGSNGRWDRSLLGSGYWEIL